MVHEHEEGLRGSSRRLIGYGDAATLSGPAGVPTTSAVPIVCVGSASRLHTIGLILTCGPGTLWRSRSAHTRRLDHPGRERCGAGE